MHVMLFPAVAIAFAVAMMIYQRKRTANQDEQYSTYRAGEMAPRLGLELLEGDPAFNLFIQDANAEMRRGPSDRRPLHVKLRMAGTPHGTPLEFVYDYRIEQKSGFSDVTRTTWFNCRLSATAQQAFPPFEVITRNAPLGPIATQQALPALATGNPQVDAMYQISCREPAMAHLLANMLPAFTMFQNSGIHLVGDGQYVSFHMERAKAPLVVNALYHAEHMSALLSDLTRRVGG